MRERIRQLADMGKAVLLVEQRARAAMRVADWTMVLVSGTSRLEGRSEELLNRAYFEALFLGAADSPPPAGFSRIPPQCV